MLPVSSILPQCSDTDFAPDQLSDSGKLASFQNGAPKTPRKHLRLNKLFLSHSVSFPFLFFSTAPSRFLSSFPRKLRGNQLVWAQNQPKRQIPGYTWKLPCDRLGILPSSSVSPQILPQTSSQTQGNSRVSRMEHQTPSVFPGNFRKRKVLGTLCFPFCFPENLIDPTASRARRPTEQIDPFPIQYLPLGRGGPN